MHRDVILKKYLERKDYYDVFLNVEDDQMFTLENLQYWHEHSPIAQKRGYRLEFMKVHPDIEIMEGLAYFSPRGKWRNMSKDIPNVHINSNASSTTRDVNASEWDLLTGESTY